MIGISRLKNRIQEYAWGSRTAIPQLLGYPSPADKPQAELWMGAHPKAPSQVTVEGRTVSLLELIREQPEEILGPAVARRFSGRLPFLFKVLAAAQPLSIQAHPNLEQAREGFARENSLGIPLDAFQRNYRDDNHKPEIIAALTPFWALNGFRPLDQILALLGALNLGSFKREVDRLRADPNPRGLRRFFAALLNLAPEVKRQAVEEAMVWAAKVAAGTEGNPPPAEDAAARTEEDLPPAEATMARAAETPPGQAPSSPRRIGEWILRLGRLYPGDMGVLAPLLLNLVRLEPGQALFLEAGNLHAYLEGLGIELMANSDNVLRGGLTPKHMDVPELLKILRFAGREVEAVERRSRAPGETVYQTRVSEFELAEISLGPGESYTRPGERSIELMICLGGQAVIRDLGREEDHPLRGGISLLVPASVRSYSVRGRSGQTRIFKAAVPLGCLGRFSHPLP